MRVLALAAMVFVAALGTSGRALADPAPVRLVDPAAVRDLRPGGAVILHAEWKDRTGYDSGHVPGALFFDTDQIEPPPLYKLVPDVELAKELASLGITTETLSMHVTGSSSVSRAKASPSSSCARRTSGIAPPTAGSPPMRSGGP